MSYCDIYTDDRKLLEQEIKNRCYFVKNGHLLVIQMHKQVDWADDESQHQEIIKPF